MSMRFFGHIYHEDVDNQAADGSNRESSAEHGEETCKIDQLNHRGLNWIKHSKSYYNT